MSNINVANKIPQLAKLLVPNQIKEQLQNIANYPDASVRAAANRLEASNPFKHSQIDATEALSLIKAAGDFDAQAAGNELKAIENFRSLNEGRLTEAAEELLDKYIGFAKAFANRGQSGIPFSDFSKMLKDLSAIAAKEPRAQDTQDKSVGRSIDGILANNQGAGSISGEEALGLVTSTGDLDAQAAGQELKDIKNFMERYGDMLSDDAKEVLEAYVQTAEKFAAEGRTGIPMSDWNAMMDELKGMVESQKTEGAEETGEAAETQGTDGVEEADEAGELDLSGLDPMMQLVYILIMLAEKLQKKAAKEGKKLDTSGSESGNFDKKLQAEITQMVEDAKRMVDMATNIQKKENQARDAITRVNG